MKLIFTLDGVVLLFVLIFMLLALGRYVAGEE